MYVLVFHDVTQLKLYCCQQITSFNQSEDYLSIACQHNNNDEIKCLRTVLANFVICTVN